MSGQASRNARIAAGASGWNADELVSAIRSEPIRPSAMPLPLLTACSSACSTARASSAKEAPAEVSSTPRATRVNSAKPISLSSAWICCESGGCWICSFAAARVNCRSLATARK
jgi:hypothetical protein